jgi:hypothetical protein
MDHEAMVRAFLKESKRRFPQKYDALERRYPVLSDWQMDRMLRTEIPVGDERDLGIMGSRSLIFGEFR